MLIIENGICYVSDDDCEFIEIPGPAPSIDDYGLDTLTRVYEGRNSLLNAFLATWLNGSGAPLLTADATYPQMFATGRPSVTQGPAFATVQVKFEGKISGAPPLTRILNDWREDVAQVSGSTTTSPPIKGTAIADYNAAITTYEYYTPGGTAPVSPSFNGVVSFGVKAITSVSTGTPGSLNVVAHGFPVGQAIIITGTSGVVPDINSYNVVVSVTDADNFTIQTNVTTGAGAGGSVSKMSSTGQGLYITGLRGFVSTSSGFFPIMTVDPESFVVVQRLKKFPKEQIGMWYRCSETWGFELGQTPEVTSPS